MKTTKLSKLRTCKVCKKKYRPKYNTIQATCNNFKCALELAQSKRKNKEKKEFRAETVRRRAAAKTRSDWLRDAQTAFNAYIRARDRGRNCISCDKPDNGTHQRHASHYRSIGACSALRFNTKNVFASCQQCNTSKSGNILEYRIRLVARYGDKMVEWLESQNKIVRYDIEYLKRLKRVFNKKARTLKKR